MPSGPRLGVLGGTFDPPHRGHVAIAVDVRRRLRLNSVLFVVANEPWQKSPLRCVTPAVLRLEMVRAALSGHDGLEASTLEIDRGGPSYTVDTLEELHDAIPSAELFLVVGSDLAGSLHTWKRPLDVESLATTVVVDRPGGDRGGRMGGRPPTGWRHIALAGPAVDVSSADVRAGYAGRRPVGAIVAPAVAEIVGTRGLYGSDR